jgi:hypothetical protein
MNSTSAVNQGDRLKSLSLPVVPVKSLVIKKIKTVYLSHQTRAQEVALEDSLVDFPFLPMPIDPSPMNLSMTT